MPIRKALLALTILTFLFAKDAAANGSPRSRISFNEDWLFQKGRNDDARFPEIDDRQWRRLSLPHDWAIEGPFDQAFNSQTGGLPVHGKAWYRKHFTLSEDYRSHLASIEFDGAMAHAKVWINGHYLGGRPNGYIGFEFDLSPYLNYGQAGANVIAVELSPEDRSSRWYPGAGIYRNVWLNLRPPIHVARWGAFVTTRNISPESAAVNVETAIENETKATRSLAVSLRIFDPENRLVAETSQTVEAPASQSTQLSHAAAIDRPALWDIGSPRLYRAEISIYHANTLIDRHETPFGIRSIRFHKDVGFELNGRPVKLQGACLHHDLGPLGAAINRRAIERQLSLLKEMGVNAIRTSHNPPAPEFLELCDQMGLLVQVESFDVWEKPKVENDYAKHFAEWHERDLRDMIRRDRNHPSVIMWSIGNEILEQTDPVRGPAIARRLSEICHQEDPTRPTTIGFNYYPDPIVNGLAAEVDIVGFNYHPASYQKTLDQHPDWIIYGSETASTVSSRGVYHLPIEKYEKHESLQVTSYDLIGPGWAYPPDIEFHFQETVSKSLGEFLWTGFDYLGEPTPYGGRGSETPANVSKDWPARSSYFGPIDLAGFPKDRFYLYQSVWTKTPMVHLLPHWNWEGREGETIPVFGYTNCDEAELFLNGKSLGKRNRKTDTATIPVDFYNHKPKSFESKYRMRWDVPYAPGALEIVAYKNGQAVSRKTVRTASPPSVIQLDPDRSVISPDGSDLSFITVSIRDERGNLCPLANNLVAFQLDGPGEIAAVGNGNPATTESFRANRRSAFNGLCLLVIRGKPNQAGKLTITATSKGLQAGTATLTFEH